MVKVLTIPLRDIERETRRAGFSPTIYRPATTRRYVYSILIDDIRAGEANWAVLSGYSRSAFFHDGTSLHNEAPYARFLEFRSKAHKGKLREYIRRQLGQITLAALDLLGAMPRPKKARKLNALQNLREQLFEGVQIGTLNILTNESLFATLSRRQRRLLRVYRPGIYFHIHSDSPLVRGDREAAIRASARRRS